MFYTKAQKHAAMCIALFWYRYDLYGYQDFTGNVRIVLMKNVWLKVLRLCEWETRTVKLDQNEIGGPMRLRVSDLNNAGN